MASALKLLSAKVLVRTFMLATLVSAGYAGKALLRADVRLMTKRFLTGPGRTSRILLVLFILTNLKSMPLAWTVHASHYQQPPFSSRLCHRRELTTLRF